MMGMELSEKIRRVEIRAISGVAFEHLYKRENQRSNTEMVRTSRSIAGRLTPVFMTFIALTLLHRAYKKYAFNL